VRRSPLFFFLGGSLDEGQDKFRNIKWEKDMQTHTMEEFYPQTLFSLSAKKE
jgi:hypothetical protein